MLLGAAIGRSRQAALAGFGVFLVLLLPALGLTAPAISDPDAATPRKDQPVSPLQVLVEKPSPTLVEQLDLPKGQGLAVQEVSGDAAARAGLKAHDILLELDGKPVPDDLQEFAQLVRDLKAKAPVADALVLRKGRRELLKSLALPEPRRRPEFAGVPAIPNVPLAPLPPPLIPGAPNGIDPETPAVDPLIPGPPLLSRTGLDGGVAVTTLQVNDRFTTRRDEGGLTITLTGKVKDGKALVNEISVQDGGEGRNYASLDAVPKRFQDKAKQTQPVRPFPGNGGMTATLRFEDRFITRLDADGILITVSGSLKEGKAKVGEVCVQEGEETLKYESVDQLPERYKGRAEKLRVPKE